MDRTRRHRQRERETEDLQERKPIALRRRERSVLKWRYPARVRIALDPRDGWPRNRERGPANLRSTKMAVILEKMGRVGTGE